jgi:hypothetical protein
MALIPLTLQTAVQLLQTNIGALVGADQSPYFGDRPTGLSTNDPTASPPPNKFSTPSTPAPRPNDTGGTVVLVSPLYAGRDPETNRRSFTLKVGIQLERASLAEASADLSQALIAIQNAFGVNDSACFGNGYNVELKGGCKAFVIMPFETLPEFRHTPGLEGVRLLVGFIVEIS